MFDVLLERSEAKSGGVVKGNNCLKRNCLIPEHTPPLECGMTDHTLMEYQANEMKILQCHAAGLGPSEWIDRFRQNHKLTFEVDKQ